MMMDTATNMMKNKWKARRDPESGGWQIVDMKHTALSNLLPDEDIPHNHPASIYLQEGAFIALIEAATEDGTLGNAKMSTQELDTANRENERLHRELAAAKEDNKRVSVEPTSEKFKIKNKIIDSMLRLAVSEDIGVVEPE